MGRLHTRYSPVRRSPPEVLPLDLHVLGLSLAFILSQDQTLRCIYNVSSSFKEIKFEAHVPQRVVVSHGPGSSAEFIKYRYL